MPFCGLAAAASAAAAIPERRAREHALKQYEITPGDWRNREKWGAYRIAVSDMADRTSTERVAWTLIEARPEPPGSKILHTLWERIEAVLT